IMQEDGTFVECPVVIKDFKPLYDRAYEYHLWTQSPDYIPPERDYAEMIRSNPQLYQKLIRFNNYRRILCTEVPGRKTQTSYQCHFQSDQQEQPRQESRNQATPPQPQHKAKDFSQEKRNNSSPYRRPENNQSTTTSTSTSSINSEEGVLEHMAIRND